MRRGSNPVILVGHSYGRSVITGAGTDDRVVGLVCICALAPDADETSQTQQSKFPTTDVFSHIEVVDGRIWLRPEGTKYFCGDLSEQERSEEHTSELQSLRHLVCRLLLEKKKTKQIQ